MTQRRTHPSREFLVLLASFVLIAASLSCGPKPSGEDAKGEATVDNASTGGGTADSSKDVSDASFNFDLTGLPPALRDELKKIKVLVVKDANITDIWILSDRSERMDLLILACSAQLLSTDMISLGF